MDKVSINGTAHPVYFSLNTKRLFCREKGIELFEMGEMFSGMGENMTLDELESLALFFLMAFREGSRKEGGRCVLILEDVIERLDDPSFVTEMFTLYGLSEIHPQEESAEKKT